MTKITKITLEVELQPFTVPNYVLVVSKPGLRQDGMTDTPKYHLSDIDPVTLDKMCRQFRDGVFEKAGKYPPIVIPF